MTEISTTSLPIADPSLGMTDPAAIRGRSAKEVAQEFESLITSLLVKQMRQASSEDGLFPGDKSDTYGGIFDMFLGRHIAQNGGIGMAEQIESAIQKSMNSSAATSDVATGISLGAS